MPTKIRISKDMILNAAFEIVRQEGTEKLSNRELANKLKCSIRPIYYQFENVEQMKKELYIKIEQYFYKFILDNMIECIPQYKQVGINYIKFAKKEKKLFQTLFMCDTGLTPDTFVTKAGHDYEEIEKLIRISTNLNDDDIKYLVGSTSINIKGNIINKHYNECYLIKKDIDVSKIKLQKEEVSEVKYFSKEDILNRISNNFEGLTEKTGPWNFLKRILESKLY